MLGIVIIVLAALGQRGANTTSALAIGLAPRDSLTNFAAGIMLIIFRPFKVGDFIEAGGSSGIVGEIR